MPPKPSSPILRPFLTKTNLHRTLHTLPPSSPSSNLSSQYRKLVSSGHLLNDHAQQHAVAALTPIQQSLNQYINRADDHGEGGGVLARWRGMMNKVAVVERRREVKGVYVWGGVGCGKSMIVDLLYDSLVTDGNGGQKKVRMHFHEFMDRFHRNVYEWRRKGIDGDVVKEVVRDMAKKWKVIYVDEFQITDVADAVVMRRLFEGLFERDVVLLATSNRRPEDLYWNGIQRELFVPLVPLFYKQCLVYEVDQGRDFRLRHGDGNGESGWFLEDRGGAEQLENKFRELSKGCRVRRADIDVGERVVSFEKTVPARNILYVPFDHLCVHALSAADYKVICEEYEVICIAGIRKMNVVDDRNAVTRFIKFIDNAYEQNVKLIVSAQAPTRDLFQGARGEVVSEEAFAVARAVSRLVEMQSEDYQKRCWKSAAKDDGHERYDAAA